MHVVVVITYIIYTFSTPMTLTLRTELEKSESMFIMEPRLSYEVKETVMEESALVIVG